MASKLAALARGALAQPPLESRGGSALLLRLFESSFFNVHLAAEYLKTYPNSIGITHYLVRRLRAFDAAEVEFYWPQLCYLVITLPTPSVALENFILERCEQDPHIAVMTLWYIQSSLSDLFSRPSSPSFTVCRRIYNRVQAFIFTDPPVPSSSTFSPSSFSARMKEKVNAPLASFVGMGLVAASVAMPPLVATSGQVAIEQGRRIEEPSAHGDSDDDDDSEDAAPPKRKNSDSGSDASPTSKAPSPLSLPKKSPAKGKTRRQSLQPTTLNYLPGPRVVPTLPSNPISSPRTPDSPTAFLPPNRPPESGGPLQTPAKKRPPASGTPSPTNTSSRHRGPAHLKGNPTSLSVPSLPTASHSASYIPHPTASTSSLSSSTLPGYGLPKAFLAHLLLLQSCRTQLDLLRSLQDISTRLVIVPKPARLSSLRAELTVLNHGLPRGCCLGMACHGNPFSRPCRAHARVVRISPSESVVLNSADRAPFVIHVEVLEDDLDFDPDRRQNAEDLRRALMEREHGAALLTNRNSSLSSSGRRGRKSLESGMDAAAAAAVAMDSSSSSLSSMRTPSFGGHSTPAMQSSGDLSSSRFEAAEVDLGSPPLTDLPEAEVDLVEQLYGDISIRDPAPMPIEEDDAPIQNRSVDEQAWARRAELERGVNGIGKSSRANLQAGLGVAVDRGSQIAPRPGGRSISNRPAISLDDYAERMRMAAIMLAQLDASQAATMGVVATGTAAAGTLVGLPVATVAGVGGLVGAGLGAVASRLVRRDVQPGQASTGVSTILDTTSAASGSSSVAGAAPALQTPSSSSAVPKPPSQRPRVLGSVEATAIRNRIMSEMLALEEERMERMREDGRARSGWAGASSPADEAVVRRAVNKDDPSGAVFAESFAAKKARIRAASPYGHLATWNVISVIVKTGADLRQEQLAIQLIKVFGQIWKEETCPSWVRYFRILVTSETSGLIETITDAVSVHSIKKDAYARIAPDGTPVFTSFSLYDHFLEAYGQPSSTAFRKAQDAFVKSLASYSVICYLLQLKDRHNGNILVDREGHLIHIDFGFMLSNSPGSLGFEMAPFKLPQDYVDILGGFESEKYGEFKALFKRTFRDARKHAERIITLVELMQKDSNLPCFANGELTAQQLRERFQLSLTQAQVEDFADKLILNAASSTFTRLYDLYQGFSQGVL